ncbi:MAG: hypothetical protein QGG36_08255 [Pirellulaceae bacterium]|jgi:type II secretory pathway component PulF|nr:hypothetical protein [Pirellulaceae bacterium]MDP7015776.1 hypothetical protein [Pirellulaceae bacterium]
MWNTALPIVLGGSVAVGIGVLWCCYLLFGSRSASERPARRVMLIVGFTMIFLGVFIASVMMLHVLAIVLLVALLLVLLISLHRHFLAERDALVWMLGACAERGIPLVEVARSFSLEHDNGTGRRAKRLAGLLERGVPVPSALAQSGCVHSVDAELALQLGAELNVLGPAIRTISCENRDASGLLHTIVDKVIYFNAVLAVIAGAKIFLVMKIVPAMNAVLIDFDLQPPPITSFVLQNSFDGILFLILGAPLILLCLCGAVVSVLHYVGLLPRDLPGLGWLTCRYDGARVLRSLGVAVRQERGLGNALRLLAARFPRESVRLQLTRAGTMCNNGIHWCDALHRVGLIGKPDAVVLATAERNNNLAWALEEMADSAIRRVAQRSRSVFNIVFSAAFLLLGTMVLILCLSVMAPLVLILSGLT